MISCKRAAELTSRELDDRLPAGQSFALGFHRLLCVNCRRFRGQLAEVDRAAGEAVSAGACPEDVRLPEVARGRIRHALVEEVDGG